MAGNGGTSGPNPLKLLVTDTTPLITLAAAEALDCLFLLGLPVVVPDAVLYEATRFADRLGAQSIIAWTQANQSRLALVPTQAFADHRVLQEADPGRRRNRDLGERAALEVLRDARQIGPGERGILLFDDGDVLRHEVVVRGAGRLLLLTTADLLRALEQAGRLQSADQILDSAVAAGRGTQVRSGRTPCGTCYGSTLERAVPGKSDAIRLPRLRGG